MSETKINPNQLKGIAITPYAINNLIDKSSDSNSVVYGKFNVPYLVLIGATGSSAGTIELAVSSDNSTFINILYYKIEYDDDRVDNFILPIIIDSGLYFKTTYTIDAQGHSWQKVLKIAPICEE